MFQRDLWTFKHFSVTAGQKVKCVSNKQLEKNGNLAACLLSGKTKTTKTNQQKEMSFWKEAFSNYAIWNTQNIYFWISIG